MVDEGFGWNSTGVGTSEDGVGTTCLSAGAGLSGVLALASTGFGFSQGGGEAELSFAGLDVAEVPGLIDASSADGSAHMLGCDSTVGSLLGAACGTANNSIGNAWVSGERPEPK